MRQLQFFLFALFLIWFANSGKLRALWTALRQDVAMPENPADVISTPSGPLHVPGAGGDPQIAPGVG